MLMVRGETPNATKIHTWEELISGLHLIRFDGFDWLNPQKRRRPGIPIANHQVKRFSAFQTNIFSGSISMAFPHIIDAYVVCKDVQALIGVHHAAM
ncbi:hypothetical protein ABKN59_003904 [Abortiporus biennis]